MDTRDERLIKPRLHVYKRTNFPCLQRQSFSDCVCVHERNINCVSVLHIFGLYTVAVLLPLRRLDLH